MNLQKTVRVITMIDVLVVVSFLMIAKYVEGSIYRIPLLGSIYELLWLLLIITLFLLPITWVFLAIKKKTSWSKAILSLVLLVGVICYMLFVY